MRFLTLDRFVKLGYNIPNLNKLDPNYRIVVSNVAEKTSTKCEIFYNDNLVFKVDIITRFFSPKNYYVNDDWYDINFFKEKGIIIGSVRHTMCILDSLYHFANGKSKKLKNLNDKQRKEWYKNYGIRNHKYHNYNSGYNEKLTNELINFITDKHNILFNTERLKNGSIKFDIDKVNQYHNLFRLALHEEFSPNYIINNLEFDISTNKMASDKSLKKAYFLINGKENLVSFSSITQVKSMYNVEFYKDNNTFYNQKDNVYSTIHNQWVKPDDLHITKCKVCGVTNYKLDVIGDFGCKHCLAEYGKIHSYSTKVPEYLSYKVGSKSNISGKSERPLFLGIEIEYESTRKDSDAKVTSKVLDGHALLKSDGSIAYGFEIVSCPATIDSHLDAYKSFFEVKQKHTTLKGASNTGMHIHVSRKAITPLTVGKLTAFFNSRDNLDSLIKIGGRSLNTYCSQDPNRSIIYERKYGRGARHVILNLTNVSTIEIRMFSSPETYQDFSTKLEFAQAVVKYCSPASSNLSLKEIIKFSNFKDYVHNHAKTYPNLFTSIKGIQ